jgi:tRNA1(Val) A37 N6-methylase TrmN6
MIEKHLFGELIYLNDATGVDTYPEDISLMFRWMQKLQLPPHPTILDIGANVGLFSLSYASIFKGAEIHCFEPVPFIYNFLKKNLEINPHLNSSVHAHSFGMSNC